LFEEGEGGLSGLPFLFCGAGITADRYIGKTISATGKIYQNYFGTASLDVNDLSQIKVLEYRGGYLSNSLKSVGALLFKKIIPRNVRPFHYGVSHFRYPNGCQ